MLDPRILVYVPALFAALFGLIVGSFANVCIHRIPREESIVLPASRCPGCRAEIAPWQNLPVLSWIFLGGRCASCREPISIRYPVVEVIHGIGFVAVVTAFGLTPFTPFLWFLFFSLTVLAFIDWDHQLLPNVVTLPGIAIGLLSTQIPGALVTGKESALAAVFGYGAFFLIARGYAQLRGIEGLGQGDWKLSAMMGAFLGPRKLMLIIFLGSLSGMIYGLIQVFRLRLSGPAEIEPEPRGEEELEALVIPDESTSSPAATSEPTEPEDDGPPNDGPNPVSIGRYRLPFGTFLAGSAIFVLFFGDRILKWYGRFFPY